MFSNEAFAQTAEKHMDTVFRVAYGWLRNPDDANDVTQDVLIELYKTDKAFESEAHLKNWLIRVTVNRCKMFFRSPGAKRRTSMTMPKPFLLNRRAIRNCSKP